MILILEGVRREIWIWGKELTIRYLGLQGLGFRVEGLGLHLPSSANGQQDLAGAHTANRP